jgi:hypothetical protein
LFQSSSVETDDSADVETDDSADVETDDSADVETHDDIVSATENQDLQNRQSNTDDVVLESHEDAQFSEELVEDSAADWSEIDPFSETAQEDLSGSEDTSLSGVGKDSEDAAFDDWLTEEIEDETLEEAVSAVEQTAVADDAIGSDSVNIESEEDWLAGLDIDDSADQAQEVNPTTVRDEFDTPISNTVDSMASESAADFTEEFSEPESYDESSGVEDIAANLWEELDLENSEEEHFESPPTNAPTEFATEDNDTSNIQKMELDFEVESEFTKEEQTIQSTKSELLSPKVDSVENTQVSNEQPLFAEMEFDDDDDDTVGYAIEGENGTVPPVEEKSNHIKDSEQTTEKQKKRLSFSNRVPDVQKIEKREVNQVFVFAGIIMLCIGVLGYVIWNSESESQDFSGMEVKSNLLKEMEEAKKGLQENDNTDGTAPDGTEAVDGEETPSDLSEDGLLAEEVPTPFEDPFPQVLPDVPEEGLDFANDKSPRALSREGYRALKDNKPDLALRLFELALKKEGNFADAVLGMGKTFQQRGEMEKAMELFCRHAELPRQGFTTQTMVEDVHLSHSIVAQLGGSCDGA